MSLDPVQLLRTLGVGARPVTGAQPTAPGGAGNASFADLLQQARKGELRSGLEVGVHPDVPVQLSPEQLARLSEAADRAEAAGVRTALVLMDGKRLVMDVHTRQITGMLGNGPEDGVHAGVDGVIDLSAQVAQSPSGMFGPLVLSPDVAAGRARTPLAPPSGLAENVSINQLLNQLRRAE